MNLYHRIIVLFAFLTLKTVKTTPLPAKQYPQLSVQFCCFKWTSLTYIFDISFSLYLGQDFKSLLLERISPTPRKSHFNFSYIVPSKAYKSSPDVLGSFRGSCACPALPKRELILQLSKQKLSFHPVLLLLQVISCSYYSYNEHFLPTQREKSQQQKTHTRKKGTFIFNTLWSATSTAGQQSEATPHISRFHSKLKLLKTSSSFLTCSLLTLFGFFISSKWERKREGGYLKA